VGILDFFSREAGQQRRAALDDFGRDLGYYVPPELRSRLGLLASMNPVEGVNRSMQASERMTAPGRSPMQRVGDAGEMLSEVAGVVAPVAVAGRAGLTGAQAAQEAFMGASFAPRSASEAMARDVLDLRAAGRADEVTEEMMAAADDQYMFANTPLPMDEASRAARAEAAGFDVNKGLYHGTGSAFDAFDGNQRQHYSTTSPDVAASYSPRLQGNIIPVLARAENGSPLVKVGGSSWGDMSAQMIPKELSQLRAAYLQLDPNRTHKTYELADEARASGYSGISFEDIVDRGPLGNNKLNANETVGEMRERQARMSAPSSVEVRFDPNQYRSRFARFDPEFKHLRNLSAGFGGLGLLGIAAGNQPAQGGGT